MAEAELPEQLQLVLEASETSLDPKYRVATLKPGRAFITKGDNFFSKSYDFSKLSMYSAFQKGALDFCTSKIEGCRVNFVKCHLMLDFNCKRA